VVASAGNRARGQELREQQQLAAVGGVGERPAEQAPGDQRQQLCERGQPDG